MFVGLRKEFWRGGNSKGDDAYEEVERVGEKLSVDVGFGDDLALLKVLVFVVWIGIDADGENWRGRDVGTDKYISGTEPNDVLTNETVV